MLLAGAAAYLGGSLFHNVVLARLFSVNADAEILKQRQTSAPRWNVWSILTFLPIAISVMYARDDPHTAEVKMSESTSMLNVSHDFAEVLVEAGSVLGTPVSVIPPPPETLGMLTLPLSREESSTTLPNGDVYIKSAYYGTVTVGSPPVSFTTVLDTGSGHLILPSMYCHSATCRVHRRYRRSASSTAVDIDFDGSPVDPTSPRDQVAVAFGTGEVEGVFVEDELCIGDSMGQPGAEPRAGCSRMRFIAATGMSADPFDTFGFDGILGLGLDTLSQTPAFNVAGVFVRELQEATPRGTEADTFSLFLAGRADEDSEFTLGGYDPRHLAGHLHWNSVILPELGHWTLPIRSIRVDDYETQVCHSDCRAVVDSGTSILGVPTASFAELYELLRHPAPLAGHCNGKGPLLHIELEDITLTLEPREYARLSNRKDEATTLEEFPAKHNRNDVECKPMLMTMNVAPPLGPKLFILGEPILRKYYSVYNRKDLRVGLGLARRTGTRALGFPLPGAAWSNTSPKVGSSMFDAFRFASQHR